MRAQCKDSPSAPGPGLTVTFLTFLVLAQRGGGVFRCQDLDVIVVLSWEHCLLGLHFWCLQDCVLGLFAKGLVLSRSV